jgi:hypothetical protein
MVTSPSYPEFALRPLELGLKVVDLLSQPADVYTLGTQPLVLLNQLLLQPWHPFGFALRLRLISFILLSLDAQLQVPNCPRSACNAVANLSHSSSSDYSRSARCFSELSSF